MGDGPNNGDQVNVLRQTQQTLAGLRQSLDAMTAAVTAQTAALKAVLAVVQTTAGSATAGAATLPANPAGFLLVTRPDGSPAAVPFYNP